MEQVDRPEDTVVGLEVGVGLVAEGLPLPGGGAVSIPRITKNCKGVTRCQIQVKDFGMHHLVDEFIFL